MPGRQQAVSNPIAARACSASSPHARAAAAAAAKLSSASAGRPARCHASPCRQRTSASADEVGDTEGERLLESSCRLGEGEGAFGLRRRVERVLDRAAVPGDRSRRAEVERELVDDPVAPALGHRLQRLSHAQVQRRRAERAQALVDRPAQQLMADAVDEVRVLGSRRASPRAGPRRARRGAARRPSRRRAQDRERDAARAHGDQLEGARSARASARRREQPSLRGRSPGSWRPAGEARPAAASWSSMCRHTSPTRNAFPSVSLDELLGELAVGTWHSVAAAMHELLDVAPRRGRPSGPAARRPAGAARPASKRAPPAPRHRPRGTAPARRSASRPVSARGDAGGAATMRRPTAGHRARAPPASRRRTSPAAPSALRAARGARHRGAWSPRRRSRPSDRGGTARRPGSRRDQRRRVAAGPPRARRLRAARGPARAPRGTAGRACAPPGRRRRRAHASRWTVTCSANSLASRVLPLPGSPPTSAICRPSAACPVGQRGQPAQLRGASHERHRGPRSQLRRKRWSRRARRRLRDRLSDARIEGRIVAQDRFFEAPQLRRGLESELLVQPSPVLRVDLQRVGLASAAIQGQHEQLDEPLARRMLGGQLFELGDDERVLARRQARVDALFSGGEAQLLEPGDLSLRERVERDIGQRRPSPQPQRIVEQAPGGRSVAGQACRPRGLDQRLETPRVDRVGLDRQAIARRHGLQRRAGVTEGAPQT